MRVTAILLFMVFTSSAVFGQDRLLWEQRFDITGGIDIARAVTVSQRTVVLVGTSSSASTDMTVRGLNKRTGKIQWSQQSSLASGINTAVYATKSQGIVYTAGYSPDGPGSNIEVHAYSAATGGTVWQDVFNRGRDDRPQDLAANRSAVVVVGYGGNTPGHTLDFLVRAYNPLTGALLWEDQVDSGGDDQAWDVALTDTQAIVAGSAGSALILRAYDLSSGTLAWDVRRPLFTPTTLQVRGGRIFVGGSQASDATPPVNVASTQVFKLTTGQVLWADTAGPGTMNDLQVRDGRVVEIGAFGVRMLDVKTGTPLWTRPAVSPPGGFESLNLVEVGPGAVFVAGSSVGLGSSELILRAFDFNGQLEWEERALSSANTAPHDLTLNGSKLFVVGHVTDTATRSFIRAYDVRGIDQSGDGE